MCENDEIMSVGFREVMRRRLEGGVIYNLVENTLIDMYMNSEMNIIFEINEKLEVGEDFDLSGFEYELVYRYSVDEFESNDLYIIVEKDKVIFLIVDVNGKELRKEIFESSELLKNVYIER